MMGKEKELCRKEAGQRVKYCDLGPTPHYFTNMLL
jgi:hypothetical protein